MCTYICFIYRSTNEEKHLRPSHHWQSQFGNASNGIHCEIEFKLLCGKWKNFKGTHFYDGERALAIKRWLNRVDEDASDLTFTTEERGPIENDDFSQMPVAIIINSRKLQIKSRLVQVHAPGNVSTIA